MEETNACKMLANPTPKKISGIAYANIEDLSWIDKYEYATEIETLRETSDSEPSLPSRYEPEFVIISIKTVLFDKK